MDDSQKLHELENRLTLLEESIVSKRQDKSSLIDHEFSARLRNIVSEQLLLVSEFTKAISDILKVNSTQSDADTENDKRNREIKID